MHYFAVEYKNLENHYHLANTKLQTEHEQKLQEMKDQSKKREEELQQEVNIYFFMLIFNCAIVYIENEKII